MQAETLAAVDRVKQDYLMRKGSYDQIMRDIDRLAASLMKLRAEKDKKEKVVLVIKVLSDSMWGESKKVIEMIVTQGLQSIFGDREMEFKVNFGTRANQVVVSFENMDGGNPRDVVDGQGGGVVDVVSFLLRLSMMLLIHPPVDRVLILDEPMKHLSEGYIARMVPFLEQLRKALGVQFIVASHISELREVKGKIITVSHDGDKSVFTS